MTAGFIPFACMLNVGARPYTALLNALLTGFQSQSFPGPKPSGTP